MLRQVGTLAVLVVATMAPSVVEAAEWKQLRKNRNAELWLQLDSIKRTNGDTLFTYRIDYAKPQKELGSGTPYLSTLHRSVVRCKQRTMSIGPTIAYEGPKASGKEIGRYAPNMIEQVFQRVEKGTSDEELYRAICHVGTVSPKK